MKNIIQMLLKELSEQYVEIAKFLYFVTGIQVTSFYSISNVHLILLQHIKQKFPKQTYFIL